MSGRSSPQNVYRNPLYYEVAFSFIDPKKQVALYERLIKRYSGTKVRRVLELGCGPGLIIREFARRGYRAVGLDRSRPMLEYLERTAKDEGVRVELVLGDMTDFRLRPGADFAMLLMGSVEHIPDRERMRTHLKSVAASLKHGGLYLVENYRLNWAWETLNDSVSWEMERDGVGVKTRFKTRVVDVLNQRVRNELRLTVNDHGKRHLLREQWDMDLIFGPEFEAMVASTRGLEFVGWFERFRLQRLKRAKPDNIGLIRKTRG